MRSTRKGHLAFVGAVLLITLVSARIAAASSGRGPSDEPAATTAGERTETGASVQTPPPPTTVDASSGAVTIVSGANSMTIGARMQFRWTIDARDQADRDTVGTGVGSADGPISQFDVPRMRLSIGGGVYRSWLRYAFQFEFSRTSSAGASKVKDAIIELRPPGRPYRLQVGQFKAPFGLQQLTSSGRQQFVDRAITDGKFTPGRDMGAMFSGTAASQTVGYAIGVFNGSGESLGQTTTSHLYVGRIFVNPLGSYSLAEGSTDAGPSPRMHVGVGVRSGKQMRGRTTSGVVEHADHQTAVNGEFAVKTSRLYGTAEYFWMTEEQRNPPPVSPLSDLDSLGFHAQAGFMLVPRTTEVGIRYAQVDGDTDASNAGVSEIRGVLGYFWRAHNLKAQADVGQVRYDARYAALSSRARSGLPGLGTRLVAGQRLADTQFRFQLQVSF